jgi:predicted metal-dependent peptidase
MFDIQLTLEQRLEKATLDLLRMDRYVAIRGALMLGTRKVCNKTPTAYTDGFNEVYGRDFCSALTDAELRGVMMHEFYHKLLRHLTVFKSLFKENAQRANRAADYVVNANIVRDIEGGADVQLPKGALINPAFDGMDVWQVYQLLDDDSDENALDDHDHENAADEGSDEAVEQAKQIDQAVREGVAYAKSQGQDVDFAEVIDTSTPWREVLQDFLTSALSGNDLSTWRKPARRYIANGLYMPSHYSESMGELVIAIDTSGSINQRLLTEALSHTAALCRDVPPEKVRVLYWDTQVQREEIYDSSNLDGLVQMTQPAGGGGTEVGCVPQYLRKNNINPAAALVLTDGYLFGYGEWDCPVLWAVLGCGSRRFNPDVGKVVAVR